MSAASPADCKDTGGALARRVAAARLKRQRGLHPPPGDHELCAARHRGRLHLVARGAQGEGAGWRPRAKRGVDLGLTDDEIAFYDALADNVRRSVTID
jgi:hypothetical protein